jgi:hypothetical protein
MIKDFGINVVLKHRSKTELDIYVNTLVKYQFEWIRLELNYYDPIPDETLDYFVKKVTEKKIKILGLLTGLVPGTLLNCTFPGLKFKNPLKALDHYLKFCEYLLNRYKNEIQYWEIWNESNTLRFWIEKPNPKDYVQLIKETSPLIKKVNPENQILFGGIMGDDIHVYAPFQKINFLRECLDLGVDTHIDIYNFHPYIPACYFSRQDKNYYFPNIKDSIDAYLEKYSDIKKPHWISEIGICPLWVKIDEKEIGEVYHELYTYTNQRNVPMFLWTLTAFHDAEYSKWNPETAFGLLKYDLSEKKIMESFLNSMTI